jgi:hypothetical protein
LENSPITLSWSSDVGKKLFGGSSTVERVFSRAGNALTKKRTRLSSANLDAQTCFAINAPFEEYLTNGNKIKKRKRPQDE